jgi:SAM-dependent methyltransferase
MLRQMAGARRFNQWMAKTVSPYVHGATIELGAGIGNLTQLLYPSASYYLATDTDTDHLQYLSRVASVETAICDASLQEDILPLEGKFNTAVCLNVLEHIPDDEGTLRNISRLLKPHGRAIVLVPQGPGAFGSLDRVLEHQRRYTEEELRRKLAVAGLLVEKILPFNRITYLGWIVNGRILRRTTLSQLQLRLLDWFVPILQRFDERLPWPSTSLIAVARRNTPE